MFQINQKVVCIDANFDERAKQFYTALPEQDKVYVIREVIDGGDWRHEPAIVVYLVGLHNPASAKPPHYERGFHERRFRPLDQVPPAQAKHEEPVLVGVGVGERDPDWWKKAA